jgi:hypothetical protein
MRLDHTSPNQIKLGFLNISDIYAFNCIDYLPRTEMPKVKWDVGRETYF